MVDNAAPSFRPIIAVCFDPVSIFDGLSVVCNIAANPTVRSNGPSMACVLWVSLEVNEAVAPC